MKSVSHMLYHAESIRKKYACFLSNVNFYQYYMQIKKKKKTSLSCSGVLQDCKSLVQFRLTQNMMPFARPKTAKDAVGIFFFASEYVSRQRYQRSPPKWSSIINDLTMHYYLSYKLLSSFDWNDESCYTPFFTQLLDIFAWVYINSEINQV